MNLHRNASEFSEEKGSIDTLEQLKDSGFGRKPGGSLMLLPNNGNHLSPKVKEIRFQGLEPADLFNELGGRVKRRANDVVTLSGANSRTNSLKRELSLQNH